MIEYTVRPGDGLSSICTRFNRSQRVVLSLNATLRTDPDRIRVGDLIVFPDVGDKAPKTKKQASAREPVRDHNQPIGDLIVPRGQLTFDAEGSDTPGPYFSRILHVPPGASGVTLGRGYDMKQRTKTQIRAELTSVGISPSVVDVLCGATELAARDARRFIAQSSLESFEITHEQQKALFLIAYDDLVKDVRRICDKSDVVRIYSATDWGNLQVGIRDVVIDLRYRGDYHPTSRRGLQHLIARNDLPAFSGVMSNRPFWIAVPDDRFQRRRDYLTNYGEQLEATRN
jgi:hypothetical protein